MIGYGICGSFCTFSASLTALEKLILSGEEVQPIMSERAYSTDTRFWQARDFVMRVEELCGRRIIHTVVDAEPLGPRDPLDLLIVSPCTGNTLAKVAQGITDTAATMAIKAHLRADRPLLIALASNDALSQNLSNVSVMLQRKSVFFTPMLEDSPLGKPHSLVAEFELIPDIIGSVMRSEQPRPLFLNTPVVYREGEGLVATH